MTNYWLRSHNGLAEATGHTPNENKEYNKSEFCPRKTIEIGGRIIDVPMGTSELSAAQMSNFVENIYQVGAMAGVVFQEE